MSDRRIEIMTWRRDEDRLSAFGKRVRCSCVVRNELNGWRKKHQIVKTMPGNHPYYPRRFPVGRWQVGTPLARTDDYKAPFFIPTDAKLSVEVWEVRDGEYYQPTGRFVVDEAYGLHHSTSGTTLGCIKIEDRDELLFLVDDINAALEAGTAVWLEVRDP